MLLGQLCICAYHVILSVLGACAYLHSAYIAWCRAWKDPLTCHLRASQVHHHVQYTTTTRCNGLLWSANNETLPREDHSQSAGAMACGVQIKVGILQVEVGIHVPVEVGIPVDILQCFQALRMYVPWVRPVQETFVDLGDRRFRKLLKEDLMKCSRYWAVCLSK